MGFGARAGDSEEQQFKAALNAILDTLESTKINLAMAFQSFDRNASGDISVSEFTSLMKTLGGLGLTRRQIFHIMNCMDENFSRSVGFDEFMEFFLVLWVNRLKEMKAQYEALSNAEDNPEVGALVPSKLAKYIRKSEKAIKLTFGPAYEDAAA